MRKEIGVCLLVAVFSSLALGKVIQVPPISSDDSIALRLDQIARIDSSFAPFGNLTRVYRKEVFEVIDGREVDFPICSEQAPQTSFWGQSYKGIANNAGNSGLVYDFEQVKYRRSLIDIAIYNGRLYYMLENGEIKINTVSPDYKSIKDYKTHKTAQSKVAKGNFILFASLGYGAFVNHNQVQLFNLSDDSFYDVSLYEQRKEFQSTVALQSNYFAAAYGTQGMRIFSVNFQNATLKVEYELNQKSSGLSSIDIKDLTYDSKRNILFIVDLASGVLSLQLSFSQSTLSAKLTSSAIKIRSCNLIYYHEFNDQLYVNCRELHKYRIDNWPIINEKTLPRQDISIKEITATASVVALVGRDIFEVIVADRKASIYEEKLLDKIILFDNHFISANENGILIGTFAINPPAVKCSTKSTTVLGTHRLVLKMTAECSQNYFVSVGFQPGTLNSDDKCVYTVYRNMVVWKPATINTAPFMVIGISLGVLGLAVLVWWAFSYLNFRKLKNYFDSYHQLQEEGGRGTDRDQEKKESNINGLVESGTDEKLQSKDAKQKAQIQNQDLHDIQ